MELEREAVSGSGGGKAGEDGMRNAEQLRAQWERARRMLGEEGREIEGCVRYRLVDITPFLFFERNSCVRLTIRTIRIC